MNYRGRVISATPPVSNTSVASGVWFLQQQMQGKYANQWPGEIPPSSFAGFVATLPQRLPGQSGTITPAQAASYGISLNNTLVYVTLSVDADVRKYNCIMMMSKQASASASNSRSSITGHNVGSMVALGSGYSSPESWIGTADARALLFANYQQVRSTMGVVGNATEVYWKRDIGTPNTNVFDRLTQAIGTDWTQNVTTKSFKQAMDVTGYESDASNGPWGSGHYGPWGWDTNYTTPPNNNSLKYKLFGFAPSVPNDGIFIFERDDNLSYQPADSHSMFVFYPDYPCV